MLLYCNLQHDGAISLMFDCAGLPIYIVFGVFWELPFESELSNSSIQANISRQISNSAGSRPAALAFKWTQAELTPRNSSALSPYSPRGCSNLVQDPQCIPYTAWW